MQHSAKILTATSALIVAMGGFAQAADILEPVVVEAPVYHAPEVVPKSVSGWYIRGDVGYGTNEIDDIHYITYGAGVAGHGGLLKGELKNSFSIGGGIGYQMNHYLRGDVTVDYTRKTDFEGYTEGTCTTLGHPDYADGVTVDCRSSDVSSVGIWTVLANAYVDLGTYKHFTPYVGAGIGGAHVRWDSLHNTIGDGYNQTGTTEHHGASDWRAAFAVMAGVSYAATERVSIDLGYRYKHIAGHRMLEYANGTGPGFDKGIKSHEFRAGLRYKFGGGGHKPHKPHVPYEPLPPIYK